MLPPGGRCMRMLLQEAQAKDSITQLKAEIANLTRLAEAGSALSSGEEAALNELMKQKEELTRERDTQVRRQVCFASQYDVLSCPHTPTAKGPAAGTPQQPCSADGALQLSIRVLCQRLRMECAKQASRGVVVALSLSCLLQLTSAGVTA